MRVLRNCVMVRVGGGWENLNHYLTRRAERGSRGTDAKKNAHRAVQDILSTTGGTGLCSTRTTVRFTSRSNRREDGRLGLRVLV